jgi:hypothetical protein
MWTRTYRSQSECPADRSTLQKLSQTLLAYLLWLATSAAPIALAAQEAQLPTATALDATSLPIEAASNDLVESDSSQFDCESLKKELGCQPQAGDEIWLVNTRQLGDCFSDCNLVPDLPVSCWVNGEFQQKSLADLLEQVAATPQTRNIVYIHGNFTDLGWSIRRGLQFYNGCFANAPARPAIRFIIWSWRSERETLLGRDYQIKSQRAVAEGCRLNSLVDRLGPSRPIVIGYSLGAQATLSALSQNSSPESQPWVVALIAAALDPHFCGALRNNSQISARFSHLVVFTNHVDPALNCSLRITRRAMANPNPPSQYSIVPNLKSKHPSVQQYEVSREVGHHHSISYYIEAPTVSQQVRALLDQ